jgi:hypothetical protein
LCVLHIVCRITILSKIEKEVNAVFECSTVLSVFSYFVCLLVFVSTQEIYFSAERERERRNPNTHIMYT